MAFMMPVMKNNYDIYKCNRSRRTSENSSSQRSRKVSESKSECTGARPSGSLGSTPAHRSVPAMMGAAGGVGGVGARGVGVPGGRAAALRPVRSLSCSPPVAAPTQEKFHTRLVDKLKRTLMRKNRDGTSVDEERTS